MLRETIEHVSADGSRRPQRAETIHAPTERDTDPALTPLQRLPDEHQPANAQQPRRVNAPESVLRLVLAVVRAHVAPEEEVVEPVAPELREYGAYHRREEEEGQVGDAEEVGGREDKLGDCADETDGPHCDYHDEAECRQQQVRAEQEGELILGDGPDGRS